MNGEFMIDGNSLVRSRLLLVYCFPHESEAFVESELFPHFESFFSTKRATFDQSMNAAMSKAVLIAGVVKAVKCASDFQHCLNKEINTRLLDVHERFQITIVCHVWCTS